MITATSSTATPHLTTFTDLSMLSDDQLYWQCVYLGAEARKWHNKFLGLLGEVYKRELYRQKGFDSIYEFAGKLASASHAQVDEAIRIEKQIKEKSALLHRALVEGEISMHKLARVASVVTHENEEALLHQVKLLSRKGLDQLVRDMKNEKGDEQIFLDVQEEYDEFEFSKELLSRLRDMKQKGINLNEALMEGLNLRKEKIEEQKDELSQECEKKEATRYIPKKIQNIIRKQYGNKCAKPGCNKPWKVIHHTARFALTKSNDPYYLAPLCSAHHEIAHAIDVKVQKHKWKK